MDIKDFEAQFAGRMEAFREFASGDDVKDIMGVEAVNHFTESFQNEGFTDTTLVKWAEVKRRQKDSEWFGHSGQTGKKSGARMTAKILTGETQELKNATEYAQISNGVRVFNTKAYAAVHNYGKQAKVYGKKAFTMIARPFIGKSAVMVDNINEQIKNRIKEILKNK